MFLKFFVDFEYWVFLSYDRVLSSIYGQRVRFLKNKKILCLLIAIIILFIGALNIANFWFSLQTTVQTASNSTGRNITTISVVCKAPSYVTLIRNMIGASSRAVFPSIIMFIGNVILVKCLMKSKRRIHSSNDISVRSTSHSSKKERSFAVSVFAMNAFLIILYLPQTITNYMTGIYAYNSTLATPEAIALTQMIFNISVYIGLVNNSISFLVNLAFNRIFRAELFLAISQMTGHFVPRGSAVSTSIGVKSRGNLSAKMTY